MGHFFLESWFIGPIIIPSSTSLPKQTWVTFPPRQLVSHFCFSIQRKTFLMCGKISFHYSVCSTQLVHLDTPVGVCVYDIKLLHIIMWSTLTKQGTSCTGLYSDCLRRESNFFGLNAPGHCLVRVRLLHCMRVRLRNGYTRAYAQIMQHTHTHKAVTGRVEAKKLLSRQRQSNYSIWPLEVIIGVKSNSSVGFKIVFFLYFYMFSITSIYM